MNANGPSTASGAVFLSYASQDTEAAQRICDALRARGVEVWFDRNDLEGGDAWDAKIKRQIRQCALFVPLISANSQARKEGYFRREWNLGADRTHDMAAGTPFLLPVVIDDTPESEAWSRRSSCATSGRACPGASPRRPLSGAPSNCSPRKTRRLRSCVRAHPPRHRNPPRPAGGGRSGRRWSAWCSRAGWPGARAGC